MQDSPYISLDGRSAQQVTVLRRRSGQDGCSQFDDDDDDDDGSASLGYGVTVESVVV
jgi:hypothetical protein